MTLFEPARGGRHPAGPATPGTRGAQVCTRLRGRPRLSLDGSRPPARRPAPASPGPGAQSPAGRRQRATCPHLSPPLRPEIPLPVLLFRQRRLEAFVAFLTRRHPLFEAFEFENPAVLRVLPLHGEQAFLECFQLLLVRVG